MRIGILGGGGVYEADETERMRRRRENTTFLPGVSAFSGSPSSRRATESATSPPSPAWTRTQNGKRDHRRFVVKGTMGEHLDQDYE
jgi:hypothetical protein